MYAQKIEGDSWRGEKLDKGKIDKMSGTWMFSGRDQVTAEDCRRPAIRTALRIDASYPKPGAR